MEKMLLFIRDAMQVTYKRVDKRSCRVAQIAQSPGGPTCRSNVPTTNTPDPKTPVTGTTEQNRDVRQYMEIGDME